MAKAAWLKAFSWLFKMSSKNGVWQTAKGKRVKEHNRMLSEQNERLDKLSVSLEQDEKEACTDSTRPHS